jgi:acyl-CoA synthetase (NDP forming)
MNPLKGFLEPDSIAIVGASQKRRSISALTIKGLLKVGYEGGIYLVNPKGGELFGLKVYSNLMEIDRPVDLAVILLPPAAVIDAVKVCGQKGIHSVIVVSDGLDKPLEGGKTIKEMMLEVARNNGVRIIGPDSMGVVNTKKKLSMSFARIDQLTEGGLSLVSQTGLFTGAVLAWILSTQRLGISKSIDLAKKCDVNEIDCLEYLRDDPSTRVIGMHIEEVADGRRFVEVARGTTLLKPILGIKAGKTEIGARAIASHTGSIAGKYELYGAAFTQSGILRIHDVEELVDLAKAFLHLPLLKGRNIGIVTYTGGWAALAADLCDEFGLSIANLSETTLQKLKGIAPPWRNLTNPVDIWPPTSLDTSEAYRAAIRAVAEDDNTDGLLIIAPAVDSPMLDVLTGIRDETQRHKEKPIVTWAVGDKDGVEKASALVEHHCIIYPTVRRAVRALSALYRYHEYLTSFSKSPER